jgi:hypothetical protein
VRTPSADRILLAAALLMALGSGAWFGWQIAALGRTHRTSGAGAKRPAAAYAPAGVIAATGPAEPWLPPPPQAKGPGWVYDVFTPPEIFYDALTAKFAVTPPGELTGTKGQAGLPGVELVEVKREPFRLQLVGYVGGEGRYLGTFENPFTSEVYLAGPGRELPELGLVVTEVSVRRGAALAADGAGPAPVVATAVVRDLRTGGSLSLTAGERTDTDELYAVLTDENDDEMGPRELRCGEEFERADHTYRIERLELDPPSAELVQTSPVPDRPVRLSLAQRTPRELPLAAAAE